MADRSYVGTIDLVEKGKPPKVVKHLVSGITNNTMARAYLTANQAINHASHTAVIGYTESYDIGGNLNATTGIYTAPVTGYYQANGSVNIWDATVKLTVVICGLYVDGSAYAYGNYWQGVDKDYVGSSISELVYLTAGQELKLGVYIQTSDTGAAVILAGEFTHLSVYLVVKV